MQVTISGYTGKNPHFGTDNSTIIPVCVQVVDSKFDCFELILSKGLSTNAISNLSSNTFISGTGNLSFEEFTEDGVIKLNPVVTVSNFTIIADAKDVSTHGTLRSTSNLIIVNSKIENDLITGTAIDSASRISIKFTAATSEINRNTLIDGANLVVSGKFRLAEQEGIGLLIDSIIAVIPPVQATVEPAEVPAAAPATVEPVLSPAQKAKATKGSTEPTQI
jgi:hypothetical protein